MALLFASYETAQLFLSKSSIKYRVLCLAGFGVPLATLGIVYFLPKGENVRDTELSDYYILFMGLYLALMLIFLLLSCLGYCLSFFGVKVFSTRVESAKRLEAEKETLSSKYMMERSSRKRMLDKPEMPEESKIGLDDEEKKMLDKEDAGE